MARLDWRAIFLPEARRAGQPNTMRQRATKRIGEALNSHGSTLGGVFFAHVHPGLIEEKPTIFVTFWPQLAAFRPRKPKLPRN